MRAKRARRRANKRERRKVFAALGRVPPSPLLRLKSTLDVYEFTAADEIMAAHAMSIGQAVARDPSLGLPASTPRSDAADNAAAHRVDLLAKYREWCADLRGTTPFAVACDTLINETALRQIDADRRWRNGTARTHLLTALRHFAALRGNVPNGARNWKIATRQLTC